MLYPAELPGPICASLLEGGQDARPRSGEGHSMDLRSAHRFREPLRRFAGVYVWLGLIDAGLGLASPALADCGSPAGTVQVVAVDERLDIALADGRLVRLGGLDTPRPERGDQQTARAARDFLVSSAARRNSTSWSTERIVGPARWRTFWPPKPRATRPRPSRFRRPCCERATRASNRSSRRAVAQPPALSSKTALGAQALESGAIRNIPSSRRSRRRRSVDATDNSS